VFQFNLNHYRKTENFSHIQNLGARRWWLTSIIPATQEAEIRRITTQSQPRKIVCKTLSRRKTNTKQGWWRGSGCRSLVQDPVLQKEKKKKNRRR
jgi:hypothetical protein